jgi:sodium transport system permease protein
MIRRADPNTSRAAPDPLTAVVFVACLGVLFGVGGGGLRFRFGEVGLLAAQWSLLLLPVLLLVRHGGFDWTRTLSLRAPGLAGVIGGAVLLSGAVPLIWFLGWLQNLIVPVAPSVLEGLQSLVTAESPRRFAWLILLLAVTPAVCEEVVFRGVLLSSTRSLGPRRMILLNGTVFGLFHLSFETLVRFLPTATLGIVIAWAVWRTGSVWVGVLMHFLNNGAIVVLASVPSFQERLPGPEARPPLWILPLGVLCVFVGARVLMRIPTFPHDFDQVPTEES